MHHALHVLDAPGDRAREVDVQAGMLRVRITEKQLCTVTDK